MSPRVGLTSNPAGIASSWMQRPGIVEMRRRHRSGPLLPLNLPRLVLNARFSMQMTNPEPWIQQVDASHIVCVVARRGCQLQFCAEADISCTLHSRLVFLPGQVTKIRCP